MKRNSRSFGLRAGLALCGELSRPGRPSHALARAAIWPLLIRAGADALIERELSTAHGSRQTAQTSPPKPRSRHIPVEFVAGREL